MITDLFEGRIGEFRFPGPSGEAQSSVLSAMEEAMLEPDERGSIRAFPGIHGLGISREYGGGGWGATGLFSLAEILGKHDRSLAAEIEAHLVASRMIEIYGTPAARSRYLPRLASGEMIGAYCISEEKTGSDAESMETLLERGDEPGKFLLNGRKVMIANAPKADLFVVFAKGLGGDEETRSRLSAIVVEREAEGVGIEESLAFTGLDGLEAANVIFEGVRVDDEDLLGDPGEGFGIALSGLTLARIFLSGTSLGLSKRTLSETVSRMRMRRAFGKPILEHMMIRERLAEAAEGIFAMEAAAAAVIGELDGGGTGSARGDAETGRGSTAGGDLEGIAIESAVLKVFTTETTWRIVDDAVQIAGGSGYRPDLPFERLFRDARAGQIRCGTNEVLRLFIALAGSRGLWRELSGIKARIRSPLDALSGGLFASPPQALVAAFLYVPLEAVIATVHYLLKRWKRALVRPGLRGLSPALSRQAMALSEGAGILSERAFAVRWEYGDALPDHEFEARRLAEMAIDIFVLGASIGKADAIIKGEGGEPAGAACRFTRYRARRAWERITKWSSEFYEADDDAVNEIADAATNPAGSGG